MSLGTYGTEKKYNAKKRWKYETSFLVGPTHTNSLYYMIIETISCPTNKMLTKAIIVFLISYKPATNPVSFKRRMQN